MRSATTSDGATITFEVQGDGPNQVVLLFRHFRWAEWGYARALPEFRFLIVDPRGHGESSVFEDRGRYGLWIGANDILAAADAAGFDDFVAWGFSQSTVRVAALATVSDRVSALICGGYPLLDCILPEVQFEQMEQEAARGTSLMPDGASVDMSEPIVLYRDLAAWHDIEVALTNLECPRLIYFGVNDLFATAIRARSQRLKHCGFSLVELPGLDHQSGLSRADVVAPVVRAFLTQTGVLK